MNGTQNPAAGKSIARQLEAVLDALRPSAQSDPAAAFYCLALAVHDAIDALDLPPIRGGGHDDFEELAPEFEADPASWPAYPNLECDGYRWTTEPTPVEVLAAEAPTEAFEPTAADWADYHAWCIESDYGVSERDLAAAGLAVG